MGVLTRGIRFGPATFVPTSIAGLKLWLDASDATSFTYSSGVVVSLCNDKSTAANHCANGASSGPSRNGTQNGLTSLVFGGTNYLLNSSATGLTGAGTTLLVTFKDDGSGSYGKMFALGEATGTDNDRPGGFSLGRDNLNNALLCYRNNAFKSIKSMTMSAWHQTTCLFTGSNNIVSIDGVAGSTVASTDALAATRIGVGASFAGQFLYGEIGEILLYDTALSGTDQGVVEAYLKAKWNTP